jgi:Flp pilus assembly protein TadB
MFLLLYFVNYDYIIRLFEDPRGTVMLGIGLAMMACGGFVMFRMVRFEI